MEIALDILINGGIVKGMKKELLQSLRKLRFEQTLKVEQGTVTRNDYGFCLDDAWFATTPSEACDYILNHEDDPYDDARM